MARVSYKVVVAGRVQGVSFRASMREVAIQNGVNGWVRNRDDGVVLSVLQGEEADVERVVEWARKGPRAATVTALRKERLERYPPQSGFRIVD
jgi:acylphosphatase